MSDMKFDLTRQGWYKFVLEDIAVLFAIQHPNVLPWIYAKIDNDLSDLPTQYIHLRDIVIALSRESAVPGRVSLDLLPLKNLSTEYGTKCSLHIDAILSIIHIDVNSDIIDVLTKVTSSILIPTSKTLPPPNSAMLSLNDTLKGK